MSIRPNIIQLNHEVPLLRGNVFAGLGSGPGSARFDDSSIYRNDGTLTNMAPATDWVQSAELGRWALAFDHTNSETVTTPLVLDTTTFTLATWATDVPANQGGIIAHNAAQSYKTLSLSLYDSSASNFACYLGDGGSYTKTYAMIPTDGWTTWHHYCVSRQSGGTPRFFRDGKEYSAVVGTAYTSTATIVLAGVYRRFGGTACDEMIYNRALTPHEIAALAEPSNTLLSYGGQDAIWTPGLKTYFYATTGGAAGGATPWLYAHRRSSRILGVSA